MDKISSKIALITGGAKRIGAAITSYLAREGYKVIVHYHHDGKAAQDLCDQLPYAKSVAFDLNNCENAEVFFFEATKLFGPIDTLIHNASIFEEDHLETLTPQSLSRHMNINCLTPILLSKAFAHQAPQNSSIIHILDQRVKKPNPLYFSYTLSKAALAHATVTMAQALSPHVRVNAIAPGPTLKNDAQSDERFQAQYEATLLQRPSSPETITQTLHFLLNNPVITGQIIAVDSGQHLNWQTPDTLLD